MTKEGDSGHLKYNDTTKLSGKAERKAERKQKNDVTYEQHVNCSSTS